MPEPAETLIRNAARSCAPVTLRQAVTLFEAQYLLAVLIAADGNRTRAAAMAGIGREHLWRMLKARRLDPQTPLDEGDDDG